MTLLLRLSYLVTSLVLILRLRLKKVALSGHILEIQEHFVLLNNFFLNEVMIEIMQDFSSTINLL